MPRMLPPMSMDSWAATKEALHDCGGETSLCPDPYPTAACPEFYFGCRLERELFTLPTHVNEKSLKNR